MPLEGNWAGTAPKRMRLRLEFSVSPGVSEATVTADLYIDAQNRISDHNNALSWSGTFGSGSSSQPVTPGTGGSQRLKTFTKVVPLTGSPQSLPFSASLSGIEYVGANATVAGNIPIPAKAVNPPSAPTNVALSRADDGSYTLTWDYSGPSIDGFAIDAAYRVGDWANIFNAGASLRRVIGFQFRANDAVVVRIAARNAAGTSAFAYSPYRRTLPAAPTNVAVNRTSPTSVQVSWQNRHQYGTSTEVWYRASDNGGATWGAWILAAGNLAHSAVSHTITLPDSTRTYQISVLTRIVSEVDWPLTALSAPSRVLGPIVPPHAPEITAPSGVIDRSTSSTLAIAWTPRHIDGTAQSAAEIQVRKADGTGRSNYTVSGAATTRAITMPAMGEWEVRVRTRGMHASYGDWSDWRRIHVAAPPTLTITGPTSPSETANVTATWTYSDPAGLTQASATVELIAPDGLIRTDTVEGDTTSLAIPAALKNHTQYTIRVTARSNSGLTSAPVASSFRTDFTPPSTPSVRAEWLAAPGEVSIDVTNPPGGPAAAMNAVERSYDGLTWELIGVIAPGEALSDYTVPLGMEPWYRAVATTAVGAVAASVPVQVTVPADAVYLRTRDGHTVALRYDLQLAHESGHEHVLTQYLGRALPTPHYGTGRPEKLTISARVVADERADLDILRGQPVWLRDPSGRAWWGSLDGSHSSAQARPSHRAVSLAIARIELEEGFSG